MRAGRWHFALVGAFAGLFMHLLGELGGMAVPDPLLVFLAAGGIVGFAAAGALMTEVSLRAALLAAPLLGLGVGLWAMLSAAPFDSPGEFLSAGHPVVALLGLGGLPLPFLTGWLRNRRPFDYPALFEDSWTLVVRYAAAFAFLGIALGVLFLGAGLLETVGITALSRLLEAPAVVVVAGGALTGLGLAVVTEYDDMISAYLFLRLLRLFTPFVLGVVAVFLAAVPLRGLSRVFEALSTGGVLLTTAAAAVMLISIVAERSDREAPQRGLVLRAAQALSALVLPLGALAALAVGLRVSAYGWTPPRLCAALGAIVVLGYGALYLAALARRGGWAAGVRRGNVAMALCLIGLAALWLNPLRGPEAISVASQMRRPPQTVPLWEMLHEWGAPGRAAVARLEAQAEPELRARIAAARAARYPEEIAAPAGAAEAGALIAQVPVLPAGARLDPELRDVLLAGAEARRALAQACAARTPGGRPGCLLVIADVSARWAGPEAVLLGARLWSVAGRGGAGAETLPLDPAQALAPDLAAAPPETWIDAIGAGLRLVPSAEMRIGGP